MLSKYHLKIELKERISLIFCIQSRKVFYEKKKRRRKKKKRENYVNRQAESKKVLNDRPILEAACIIEESSRVRKEALGSSFHECSRLQQIIHRLTRNDRKAKPPESSEIQSNWDFLTHPFPPYSSSSSPSLPPPTSLPLLLLLFFCFHLFKGLSFPSKRFGLFVTPRSLQLNEGGRTFQKVELQCKLC